MSLFSPSKAGAFLVVVTGAILVRLESPLDPVVWSNPTDLPVLEGALSPNERLLAAEHLHEGELIAPEAFAEGDDGALFTGTWDGRVYRMNPDGTTPTVIFFTGGVVSAAGRAVGSTTGVEYGSRLMHECHEKAKAEKLTLEDERRCGRPLGVRWRDGKLYVLDAYHGLFELDFADGVRGKHLINPLTDFPVPLGDVPGGGGVAKAEEATLPLTFLNDFHFTEEGTIFLSDSSWKYPRYYNRRDIIDGGPNGRLLMFEPGSGDLRTVMCGLHFPNGVEVHPSGKKLLVVESMRFRVLEVDLAHVLQGMLSPENSHGKGAPVASLADGLGFCGEDEALPEGVRVFAEALPGFVDNLVLDKTRGGYVAGAGTKVAAPFSALHLALKKPGIFRNIIGKLVPMKVLDKLVPSYGLVFVLGFDGTIKESMHNATGRTAFISTAYRSSKSGYTFLGSSQNHYLGRVRL